MQIKTKDKTFKWVEVMVIMETLRYSQINNLNEYSVMEHRNEDSNIEDWLYGRLRIFNTEETATKILTKEYQEEIDKKRSYIT